VQPPGAHSLAIHRGAIAAALSPASICYLSPPPELLRPPWHIRRPSPPRTHSQSPRSSCGCSASRRWRGRGRTACGWQWWPGQQYGGNGPHHSRGVNSNQTYPTKQDTLHHTPDLYISIMIVIQPLSRSMRVLAPPAFSLHQAPGGNICARKKVKICAKYARNMRNPKNGVRSATPYLITQALLLQNTMIFLIRKKC
jgi:hypothetical protein